MFNGYHETPATTYNESDLDRGKKQQKWPCPNGTGIQSNHIQGHQTELWTSKSQYLGMPNSVNLPPKCSCPSCYQVTENQSYQGDISWHRSWFCRAFPVPLNDQIKIQPDHWDNGGFPMEAASYPDSQYAQDTGEKSMFYKSYANLRHPDIYQAGIIKNGKISRSNDDQVKLDDKMQLVGSDMHNSNIGRFPSPGYDFRAARRVEEGSGYYNQNESCRQQSNLGSYMHPNMSRRTVLEPFIKTVPSNMNQNRVPSDSHRSLKDNVFHYDQNFSDKILPNQPDEKHCKSLYQNVMTKEMNEDVINQYTGDCHGMNFNRDLSEKDLQKFMSDRNQQYFPRNNYTDMMKRSGQTIEPTMEYSLNRKGVIAGRTAQTPMKNNMEVMKSSNYQKFVSEKIPDSKMMMGLRESEAHLKEMRNENVGMHISRPVEVNDPFATEKAYNCLQFQAAYKSCKRPEFQYPRRNVQGPYEYPVNQRNSVPLGQDGYQNLDLRNSFNAYSARSSNSFLFDGSCQQVEKFNYQNSQTQSISPSYQTPEIIRQNHPMERISHLESICQDDLKQTCKNGTSKISPLRLLRKKKFINPKKETAVEALSSDVNTKNSTPPLDVRRFWATWAEEEEENVQQTHMVVLDCHNIDPDQAGLLHLYNSEPIRTVHLDTNILDLKSAFEKTEQDLNTRVLESENQNRAPCDFEMSDIIGGRVDAKTLLNTVENRQDTIVRSTTETQILDSVGQKESAIKLDEKLSEPVRDKSHTVQKQTENSVRQFEIFRNCEKLSGNDDSQIEDSSEADKSHRTKADKCDPEDPKDEPQESLISSDDSLSADMPTLSDLPTSEYRKNKFLDFTEDGYCNTSLFSFITNGSQKPNVQEVKNDQLGSRDDLNEDKVKKLMTDAEEDDLRLKEMGAENFEIDEILQKLSDINFQSPETVAKRSKTCDNTINKTENQKKDSDCRRRTKKPSHKSSRTDQLTLENFSLTKPTIKFSIQKSHDLKISLKVLNNKFEENSDGDYNGEVDERECFTESGDERTKKNRRRLITLKLKGLENEGDGGRGEIADEVPRKSKKKKKDRESSPKTPVLKIKKTRYMMKDGNEESGGEPFAEPSDDLLSNGDLSHGNFQVHETVDSAKIKLTFKRNKANVDTTKKNEEEPINFDNTDFKCSKEDHSNPNARNLEERTTECESPSNKNSDHSKQEEIFLNDDDDGDMVVVDSVHQREDFGVSANKNDADLSQVNESESDKPINEAKSPVQELTSPEKPSKSDGVEPGTLTSGEFCKSEDTLEPLLEVKEEKTSDQNEKVGSVQSKSETALEVEVDCSEKKVKANQKCEITLQEEEHYETEKVENLEKHETENGNQTEYEPHSSVDGKSKLVDMYLNVNADDQFDEEKHESNEMSQKVIDPSMVEAGEILEKSVEIETKIEEETKIECLEQEMQNKNEAFSQKTTVNVLHEEPETATVDDVKECDKNEADIGWEEVESNQKCEISDKVKTSEPSSKGESVFTPMICTPQPEENNNDVDMKLLYKKNICPRRQVLRRCSCEGRSIQKIPERLRTRSISLNFHFSAPEVVNSVVIEPVLDVAICDIPLPPGDPPPENCIDLEMYLKTLANEKKGEVNNLPSLEINRTVDDAAGDEVKQNFPAVGVESPLNISREDRACKEDSVGDRVKDIGLYECDDLAFGESTDIEEVKVSDDDKFRNVMQNCLENAKKFLSVGNLKLFSCSVDNLLEIDCKTCLIESVDAKPVCNHISKDVLLTSCEGSGSDELVLTDDGHQPIEISVDFVPSFCPDNNLGPEILPVDNWPYLEEEVPSSPLRKKPEDMLTSCIENGLINTGRFLDSGCITSRRVSEGSKHERTATNIVQRRRTIEGISEGRKFGWDVGGLQKIESNKIDILKSTNRLDMCHRKHKQRMEDESSYSGQRKVQKIERSLGSTSNKNQSSKTSTLNLINPESVVKKRKKQRFRNLHTKKRIIPELTKDNRPNMQLVVSDSDSDCELPKEIVCSQFKSTKCSGRSEEPERHHTKPARKVTSPGKRSKDGDIRKSHKRGHAELKERKVEEKPIGHRQGSEKPKGFLRDKNGRHNSDKPRFWICEVCGFTRSSERATHIQTHPFHCQSCHLAFKTETNFVDHLTRKHKDIRNQHHCLLCELSFDLEKDYHCHLETREHKHLESVEKNTINTLFTLWMGQPCPVLGPVEMKPEWLPTQAGTVHFYHQATPLSLALQYLKLQQEKK